MPRSQPLAAALLAAVLLAGCAPVDSGPPAEPVAAGCEEPGELAASAMATGPVYRDVADLVATADLIVRGAAISCRAGMAHPLPPTSTDPAVADAAGTPIAIVTLRVTEAIKGDVDRGDLVEVARMAHTDDPRLDIGEDSDHVLLLEADFPDMPRWPLNPTQGVYRVVGDGDLKRDAESDDAALTSLEELRAAAAVEAECPRPDTADRAQAHAAMTSAFPAPFSDYEPAASLRALAGSSDVVVRAKVARFQPGRTEVVIGSQEPLGTSSVMVLTGVEVADGALSGDGEEVFVELPRAPLQSPETLPSAFPACTDVVLYLQEASDGAGSEDVDTRVTDPQAGRPRGEPLYIPVSPEGFAVQSPHPTTVVWPLLGEGSGSLLDVLPDGDLLPPRP